MRLCGLIYVCVYIYIYIYIYLCVYLFLCGGELSVNICDDVGVSCFYVCMYVCM